VKHEIEQSVVEIQTDSDAGKVDARFCFQDDLTVFSGHFPEVAIVPGIYLIEASRILAERLTGETLQIEEVADARFTREIHPGDDVIVEATITRGVGNLVCEATFTTREVRAAKVRLFLRAE
jgi:3-hydroxymyristoyl/3-hydroxydecanoyl-(acyl carrier protein) dehydratase